MTDAPSKEPVRYVVVVHGIGEQRENETLLPVIDRFAEARSGKLIGDPLTLGSLSGQRERRRLLRGFQDKGWERQPWVEFEGIPGSLNQAVEAPFVGRVPLEESSGSNIRFVDLHWADILDEPLAATGEPVAQWTASLLDRLRIRNAEHWIVSTLQSLRAGIVPLQKLLAHWWPGESDKIFDQFLGDVQLYGEYLPIRGRAVRRFHELMAHLHKSHGNEFDPSCPPSYTIIAHSLGSIMAFDALLFAHGGDFTDPNLRRWLPGYEGPTRTPSPWRRGRAQECRAPRPPETLSALPKQEWVQYADSLVTLGSPIDKYLLLWWQNYEYLESDAWMADELREGRKTSPIRHFNYCDEQDPVGHELDVAYTTEAVLTVFGDGPVEERIFSRYALPGVAHVKYWTDRELFARIVDLTIDSRSPDEAAAVDWFKPLVHLWADFLAYAAIPLAGSLAATGAMVWALEGSLWRLLPSAFLVIGTCWLMLLMIRWREVLAMRGRGRKGRVYGSSDPERPADAGDARERQEIADAADRSWRRFSTAVMTALMTLMPLGALMLFSFTAEALSSGQELNASVWSQRWAAPGTAAAPLPHLGVLRVGVLGVAEWISFDWGVERMTEFAAWAREASLFGWSLPPVVGERVLPALASLFAFAFSFSLWNVIVLAWMTYALRDARLEIDFGHYLARDPTQAPETVSVRRFG